jgi:hypothetical protein
MLLICRLLFDRGSIKCNARLSTLQMSQTQSTATKYNEANADTRTNLLRTARVEESQIVSLAKSRFETLSKDVQDKLRGPGPSA